MRLGVVESEEAEFSQVIYAKFFTTDDLEYVISLGSASAISCCYGTYMTESKSLLKHMFLAQITLGCSISLNITFHVIQNLVKTQVSAEQRCLLRTPSHNQPRMMPDPSPIDA